MCKDRPCWGTPDGINKLIDAGFADKLMLDWWVKPSGDVYIIAPAIVGREKRLAPSMPYGRCTLLTNEDLCPLHDRGLKPFEGRMAHHDHEDNINSIQGQDLHNYVANTWNTPKGQEVVNKWKSTVGYPQ